MKLLQRLSVGGARLVTPELASGQLALWPEQAWAEWAEPFSRALNLDPLLLALDELVATTPAHDAALDARAAPLVHRLLPLTRREASEPGLWRYLAVVQRPDVVRHRWEATSWSSMRKRFWSIGTRPDSNAFSRWWWIAELTREGADYGLTERALRRQPVATSIFVRTLSYSKPAVRACVEVLEGQEAAVIERTMTWFSRWLAKVPLEALSHEALVAELERLVRMHGRGEPSVRSE